MLDRLRRVLLRPLSATLNNALPMPDADQSSQFLRLPMIKLSAGPYRLAVTPAFGGILSFDFAGEPLFRPSRSAASPLDVASFPLAPFSNRIAKGRFRWENEAIVLQPNHPAGGDPHAIHGAAWLATWAMQDASERFASFEYLHAPGAWPWRYRVRQSFALNEGGLIHAFEIENLDMRAMPAGLGQHPYFPCTALTRLEARHRGIWTTGADGLPLTLDARQAARDWLEGAPVSVRAIDTVMTGREGPMRIVWPERRLALTIDPSPDLAFTVIYVPNSAGFFCVEPVSHMTNAVNRPEPYSFTGLRRIEPGGRFAAEIRYSAAMPA